MPRPSGVHPFITSLTSFLQVTPTQPTNKSQSAIKRSEKKHPLMVNNLSHSYENKVLKKNVPALESTISAQAVSLSRPVSCNSSEAFSSGHFSSRSAEPLGTPSTSVPSRSRYISSQSSVLQMVIGSAAEQNTEHLRLPNITNSILPQLIQNLPDKSCIRGI